MRQLQLEVVAVQRRVSSEEPGGLEDLLEGAHRLDPTSGEPPARAGEKPEPALVLAVQVYAGAAIGRLGDQMRTERLEVFLKAIADCGSFLTCDLRATLLRAPNLRLTNWFIV